MKVAVSGAAGRMGKRITALAHEHPEIEISGALESPGNPSIGNDAGEAAGIGHIGVAITDDIRSVIAGCDVLIDFSAPSASVEHVKAAAEANKAVVVGTTGFTDEQRTAIYDAANLIPCVMAPNMSMGVNLLFDLVGRVAEALGPDYDVEIIEAHHKMKKDAPSGTADKLARIIADALDRDLAKSGTYGRHGLVGERKPEEIGVMAVRGGDIVGEHTVMFVTGGERLELIHRAHSRDAFAKGAVQAALFVASKSRGLYDMQDVLGLKATK
ncbi:MAG TPA: 4-hydroxy-tetrahydrodipicolinate reductase [Desulfomonilaceae bacterium]|nr:4-hydroxy-tetrahydrodipicolinate reductase [Desulfomonilaceae bacterium]